MTERYESFLSSAIIEYKAYCELTSNWHHDKAKIIRRFDKFCSENYSDETELTQEITKKKKKKRKTEIANSCRARLFPAIGLIHYMNNHHYCSVDIPDMPDGMPCTYVPHIMSDSELQRFFLACDTIRTRGQSIGNYNRKITIPVIFRLLYSSGMRPYEARMMETSDINLKTGIIRIKEVKGKYQHYVVLHDTVVEIMREYDQAISNYYPNRRYFFPGNGKTEFVSQEWLSRNFRELWHSVNTSQSRPYDFRHNYAIANINSWSGDLEEQFSKLVYLSKSMGHRDLNSTRYYYAYSPRMAELIRIRTADKTDIILPEITYEDFE